MGILCKWGSRDWIGLDRWRRDWDGERAVGGSIEIMRHGARIYHVYAVVVSRFSVLFDLLPFFLRSLYATDVIIPFSVSQRSETRVFNLHKNPVPLVRSFSSARRASPTMRAFW
jgi:hypothetical protein